MKLSAKGLGIACHKLTINRSATPLALYRYLSSMPLALCPRLGILGRQGLCSLSRAWVVLEAWVYKTSWSLPEVEHPRMITTVADQKTFEPTKRPLHRLLSADECSTFCSHPEDSKTYDHSGPF